MNNLIDLEEDTSVLINGLTGNRPIRFIQGDTYTYIITFEDNALAANINNLLFVCNYFGIEIEFGRETLPDGTVNFFVDLNTENAVPITTSYDVVAYIQNGNDEIIATQTDIPFIVVKRENKLTEEGGNDAL